MSFEESAAAPAAPPVVPAAPSRLRKRIMMAVQLVVLAVICGVLGSKIAADWDKLKAELARVEPSWLVLAGGLYLASMLPNALFWKITLDAVGAHATTYAAVRAHFIGQLGKYLPGKALVVILRVWYLPGGAAGVGVVAATIFYETFAMMAVGGLLGAVLLTAVLKFHPAILVLSLGVAGLVGIPLLPPVFRRLARLARLDRLRPELFDRLERLDLGRWAVGLLGVLGGWFLHGLALWAVLRALQPAESDPLARLFLCTAAGALSTVLGFASLLPGGAGVREWVLVEMLSGPLGSETLALSAPLVFRLVQLGAELALASVLQFVPAAAVPSSAAEPHPGPAG